MRFWSALLIVVAGFCVPANAGDPPRVPAAPAAAIEWRRNLLDAFVEAAENKKPLVVLFASRPSTAFKTGRNLSNEQWVEFDRPEIQALAGEAVFVVCYFDHATGTMIDPRADAMRSKLKVTQLPTTSVIAPNVQRLVEVYRWEGLFPADALATELRRKLTTALKPEHLAEKATAKPVAKTAAEAVALWNELAREGDPDLLADLMPSAAARAFISCWHTATDLGHAKRRLLTALDEQFGKQADTIPWGVSDDEVIKRLQKCRLTIKSADDAERGTEVVAITDQANGKGVFEAVKTDGGWKIAPADAAKLADPEVLKKHLTEVKAQAAALDAVTKRVRAGEFATREEARAAGFEAFTAATKK